MIIICEIDAVHPVAKRVVKKNLTPEEMADLLVELVDAGYDIENIECSQRTIYEEGDTITLKLEEVLKFKGNARSRIERVKAKDIMRTLNYIYKDKIPDEIKCEVTHIRANRSMGIVHLKWLGEVDDFMKETNTLILDYLGYEFKDPEFEEIPIEKADDDLLDDNERVIKYLMLDNHWNEKTARGHLETVFKAMNKAECVFYRP